MLTLRPRSARHTLFECAERKNPAPYLSVEKGDRHLAGARSCGGQGRPARSQSPFSTDSYPPSWTTNPRLARLAEQLRQLSTAGARSLPRCPSGLPTLDAALGGGLARGAVHEFLAPGGRAAARSVALLTATRAADRQRWIFYLDTTQDFYPPGAAQLGVPLERLLVIRAPRQAEALWVAEQSLRCRGVAAVILPLWSLDAQASRRLQLAAEAGGTLGLLIRSDEGRGFTFAATRLRFDPLRRATTTRRLLVSILKQREGRPREPIVLELPDFLSVPALPAAAADTLPPRRTGSAN